MIKYIQYRPNLWQLLVKTPSMKQDAIVDELWANMSAAYSLNKTPNLSCILVIIDTKVRG